MTETLIRKANAGRTTGMDGKGNFCSRDVISRLRGDASDRPMADCRLAEGLRAWIEDEVSTAIRRVSKAALPLVIDASAPGGEDGSVVAACSARAGTMDRAGKCIDLRVARDMLVRAIFSRQLTTGWIDSSRYMDEAIEMLDVSHGPLDVISFLRACRPEVIAKLKRDMEYHVRNIASGWARIPGTWYPRLNGTFAIPFCGGDVVLTGTCDLILGGRSLAPTAWAQDVRRQGPTFIEGDGAHQWISSALLVSIHSGEGGSHGAGSQDDEDGMIVMEHLALLETLRSGIPPYRVALWSSSTGELRTEKVSERILKDALDRVVAAVGILADSAGDDATRRGGERGVGCTGAGADAGSGGAAGGARCAGADAGSGGGHKTRIPVHPEEGGGISSARESASLRYVWQDDDRPAMQPRKIVQYSVSGDTATRATDLLLGGVSIQALALTGGISGANVQRAGTLEGATVCVQPHRGGQLASRPARLEGPGAAGRGRTGGNDRILEATGATASAATTAEKRPASVSTISEVFAPDDRFVQQIISTCDAAGDGPINDRLHVSSYHLHLPAADDTKGRQQAEQAFRMSTAVVKKAIGMAAISKCVRATRQRASRRMSKGSRRHDWLENPAHYVDEILSTHALHTPGNSERYWWAGWCRRITPAQLAVVRTEAASWATTAWLALDWSRLPVTTEFGPGKLTWAPPGCSRVLLTARYDLKVRNAAGRFSMLTFFNGHAPSRWESVLCLPMLVAYMRGRSGQIGGLDGMPIRAVGVWLSSGQARACDLSGAVLESTAMDVCEYITGWVASRRET
ncbi:MAG: hypothetical protein M1399_04015 [Actinobacteria bacterium]|nr:hypothetical protein [Actinomycetota bacterium]MCL5447557.1 hypothetical protein [Actinomycetota bacterium]